jgi:Icc-related predicted phosphoesterase
MSFHTTTSQSAYPTTTKDTSTTTTSTISTAQLSASSIPTINTRQTGGHAKSLGLDWSAPTDRATYLQLVDLPEIFGAVLNNDWETAGKLTIKPALIGDYWMPLAIQSHSITNAVDDHLAPWADDLPSKNKKKQQWAIIDMAHDKVHKTTVDGAGSVYGANLLTLCIGMRALTAFLQKVITLSKEHAPRHLNKPDASGKTPLYVAIQQGDLAAVQMLLDAGADWRTRSNLIKYDGTKGGPDACQFAMKVGSDEIIDLMLSQAVKQLPAPDNYPIANDPFQLAQWVAAREERDVLRLAEKFKPLQFALFSFLDKSGSSLYRRFIENNVPVEVNTHTLINPIKENNVLYISATYGPPEQFFNLLNFLRSEYKGKDLDSIATYAITIFLKNKTVESMKTLSEQCDSFDTCIINAKKTLLEKESIHSFEKFKLILESVCKTLNKSEKIKIFINLGQYDSRYVDLFIKNTEFEVNETLFTQLCKTAANWRNTEVFDYAAEQSSMMITALNDSNHSVANGVFSDALFYSLRARSGQWTEKLLQACPDLQRVFNQGSQFLLPALADFDPSGFSARLEDIDFDLDMAESECFELIQTDEGRQALADLISARRKNH